MNSDTKKRVLYGTYILSVCVLSILPLQSLAIQLDRNLFQGMRGNDVSTLQQYLQDAGDYTYPEITGYYGSATVEAVQHFQYRNNIVSFGSPSTTGYGAVGPATRKLLLTQNAPSTNQEGVLSFIYDSEESSSVETSAYKSDACVTARVTQIVHVEDFGTVGDGVTDDTTAIKAASACAVSILNDSASHSVKLIFPVGRFLINDQINFIDTGGLWKNLTIQGQSQGTTNIYTKNTGLGLFWIRLKNSGTSVDIGNMSFHAMKPDTGTVINITNQGTGSGASNKRSLHLKDIRMGGYDFGKDYFTNGLQSSGLWRPRIEDVYMAGPYGPNADGSFGGTCYYLANTYSPEIDNSGCWTTRSGIFMSMNPQMPATGSFLVESTILTEVDRAVIVQGNNRTSGTFEKNHVNALISGTIFDSVKSLKISRNIVTHGAPGANLNTPYDDFKLTNANNVSFKDNVLYVPRGQTTTTPRTGLRIGAGSLGVIVEANLFQNVGVGVRVEPRVTNTRIIKNRFFADVMETDIIDSGSNTTIIRLPSRE